MNGRRQEVFHFTEEQVLEHARAALAIVDELEVGIDLRAVVFERAFDRLSSKQVVIEQIAPGLAVPGL